MSEFCESDSAQLFGDCVLRFNARPTPPFGHPSEEGTIMADHR